MSKLQNLPNHCILLERLKHVKELVIDLAYDIMEYSPSAEDIELSEEYEEVIADLSEAFNAADNACGDLADMLLHDWESSMESWNTDMYPLERADADDWDEKPDEREIGEWTTKEIITQLAPCAEKSSLSDTR